MVVGGKREPGGRELHSALPSGPDAFVKLALCLLWIGRLDFRSELSLYLQDCMVIALNLINPQ